MCILSSFVFAAVSAVSYDGTAVSPSGAVELTLNDEGAITSLVATPDSSGGTVVINGDDMCFAAGAMCKLATPGTLVFSNAVSAAGALSVGVDDPDAEISYSGEILPGAGYVYKRRQ